MTDQEIFDKILFHLRKQGKAARDDTGNCAYRGAGGTMCAVGCLISDDMYDPAFEGLTASAAYPEDGCQLNPGTRELRRALDAAGIDPSQWELLMRMQSGHDCELDAHGPDKWEKFMFAQATLRDLIYTPPAP